MWAEPDLGGTGGFIINVKDQVEDTLGRAVCDGRVQLRAAQDAITANWTTAESALGVK